MDSSSDLRWEHTTAGRQSAMLLRALRGHRETHFTILKYSLLPAALLGCPSAWLSACTTEKTSELRSTASFPNFHDHVFVMHHIPTPYPNLTLPGNPALLFCSRPLLSVVIRLLGDEVRW